VTPTFGYTRKCVNLFMNKTQIILYWAARIVAALIMFQTLYFKFSAAPESVEIFTKVGMEPWGRLTIGALELVASVLLLITPTAWLGAVLGAGLMAGAIGMHITKLGIVVDNDGGYLFGLAVSVFICCLYVLALNRSKIGKLIAALR
jgi:putative oxidoreductase